MRVKKQQLEPCVEQPTGSGLRKEYDKAVYCQSTCFFNLYAGHIMQNAELDELEAGIKTVRYVDDITLRAESKED